MGNRVLLYRGLLAVFGCLIAAGIWAFCERVLKIETGAASQIAGIVVGILFAVLGWKPAEKLAAKHSSGIAGSNNTVKGNNNRVNSDDELDISGQVVNSSSAGGHIAGGDAIGDVIHRNKEVHGNE